MKSLTLTTDLKMSSLEIAELTGKRHDNVLKDIRNMLDQLGIDAPKFLGAQGYGNNNTREIFNLPKDLTLTLVTGYSIPLRHKINQRWMELESKTQMAMPNFNNPAEAARAWALAYEEAQLAIQTKAEIGSRREATSMATASAAVRKAHKLEAELDRSKEYCTIKRMSMLHHGLRFDWRLMKATSIEMGVQPIDVFDQNYGVVKGYHADVWREAYALGIPGLQDGVQ
jgi:phage regulator Rha-like protein